MKPNLSLSLTLLASVFLLSACESAGLHEFSLFKKKDPNNIYLNDSPHMSGAVSVNSMNNGAPMIGVPPMMPNAPMAPMDSSVDVYPHFGGPMGMPMANDGVISGDPSVTVFNVNGGPMTASGMGGYSGDNSVQVMQNFSSGYGNGYSGGNDIYFKFGSSRLGGGDKRKLSNIAEQAKFAPVNRITVEGYASRPTQFGNNNTEAQIVNLKESMNRTFEVSKKLIREGVPADKIKAVSWGASKANGSDSDRRVEVTMGER